MYFNPKACIYINGETPEAFPLRSRGKKKKIKEIHYLHLLNIVLEILANANELKETIRGIGTEKGGNIYLYL